MFILAIVCDFKVDHTIERSSISTRRPLQTTKIWILVHLLPPLAPSGSNWSGSGRLAAAAAQMRNRSSMTPRIPREELSRYIANINEDLTHAHDLVKWWRVRDF